MDIAQQLERAIPAGPPLPPPQARAEAGRAALRRRRTVVALAAAGAVAAVVVPFAVAAGGTATRGLDPAPPASGPTLSGEKPDTAPGTRLERDPAASYPWRKDEVVAVSLSGGRSTLLIRPGAVVLERRDDLYPGKDTESAAMRLRFEGLEYWALWEWDEGGAVGASGSPRDPFYRGYADFVAKSTSGGGMTSGPAGPLPGQGADEDEMPTPTDPDVRWAGGAFAAGPDARIIEQRPDPDLPRSFAEPGATTAAAYVEDDGVRSLVLYRDSGGAGQAIAVEAAGHGDSLEQLLEWARGRYRSGVGLL